MWFGQKSRGRWNGSIASFMIGSVEEGGDGHLENAFDLESLPEPRAMVPCADFGTCLYVSVPLLPALVPGRFFPILRVRICGRPARLRLFCRDFSARFARSPYLGWARGFVARDSNLPYLIDRRRACRRQLGR